jgi:hypothetical protein
MEKCRWKKIPKKAKLLRMQIEHRQEAENGEAVQRYQAGFTQERSIQPTIGEKYWTNSRL